jgi:hypothetical protein
LPARVAAAEPAGEPPATTALAGLPTRAPVPTDFAPTREARRAPPLANTGRMGSRSPGPPIPSPAPTARRAGRRGKEGTAAAPRPAGWRPEVPAGAERVDPERAGTRAGTSRAGTPRPVTRLVRLAVMPAPRGRDSPARPGVVAASSRSTQYAVRATLPHPDRRTTSAVLFSLAREPAARRTSRGPAAAGREPLVARGLADTERGRVAASRSRSRSAPSRRRAGARRAAVPSELGRRGCGAGTVRGVRRVGALERIPTLPAELERSSLLAGRPVGGGSARLTGPLRRACELPAVPDEGRLPRGEAFVGVLSRCCGRLSPRDERPAEAFARLGSARR